MITLVPLTQPSIAGQDRGKRGLSDRAQRGINRPQAGCRRLRRPQGEGRVRPETIPQRPFSTEERRAVRAQRGPSLGVPFLLATFLWASKEK